MSGETEQAVSGWTTDTLREDMLGRLDSMGRLLQERYETQQTALATALTAQTTAMNTALTAAERAVNVALLSAEKATTKAEIAADKRFEAMNEFRQQLADQSGTFATRNESEATHRALIDKIETATGANALRISEQEQRLTIRLAKIESRQDVSSGTDSGTAAVAASHRANIAVIIAAASLALLLISVIVTIMVATKT